MRLESTVAIAQSFRLARRVPPTFGSASITASNRFNLAGDRKSPARAQSQAEPQVDDPVAFLDAERDQRSILTLAEKRALRWLAARMPAWITSDHLTLLGFAATLIAGGGYALSRWNPMFLHLVNAALVLNWFGDSLDGTLARYRNRLRPRYGFYVDHIIDTVGILFIVAGLAASGYMSERIALWFLVAYFMLSINVYLATYVLGRFQMSFWQLGPTELRIIVAIGNLVLLVHPRTHLFGRTYLVYDLGALVGIVCMFVMLVVSAIENTRTLYREESSQ